MTTSRGHLSLVPSKPDTGVDVETDLLGIRADVVSGPFIGACNVLVGHVDKVTIVGIQDRASDMGRRDVEPLPELLQHRAPTPTAPPVVLVKRSRGLMHFEPLAGQAEHRWYAMGGAFLTGDGSFSQLVGLYAAIPLHDWHERQ